MRRVFITGALLALGFFNRMYAVAQVGPPPVSPTVVAPSQLGAPTASPAGANPGSATGTPAGPSGDVDSAISILYSQIPTILTACQQLTTQVEQGLGYVPNTSSPMPLIMQYIELQDIQISCEMIMKTKAMADQFQTTMGGQNGQTGQLPPPPSTP